MSELRSALPLNASREPSPTASQALRTIALTWLALWVPFGVVSLIYALHLGTGDPEGYFMVHQDAAVVFAAPLAAFILALAADRMPAVLDADWLLRRQSAFAAAAVVTVIAGAGVWLVFQNHPFACDEFMANFDAEIFASGRLMAQLPSEFRPFAWALQPQFVWQTEGHQFWASNYLPVNALMRAGASALRADWLVNPILAAVAIVATWAAGRRLWPDKPRRAVAAALLLATSSQVVITAMTSYAMTAHLALNAVWLWLLLRDRRSSDLAAFAVGFAATGLHQLFFHPLFAAPFILEMLIARRWARAASFIGAYVVIGLFWIFWWAVSFRITGAAPISGMPTGPEYFLHTLRTLVSSFGVHNVGEMLLCLSRLIAWQNLLTAPLALIGIVLVARQGGPLRAMALAIVIVPVFLMTVMPGQVHGWGYRYLHPFLGSGCLLAVFAWGRLTERLSADQQRQANRAFALASLASLVVLMPVHALEARAFTHPAVVAEDKISHRPEAFVIVDSMTVPINFDIRNDPFLTNRPKVLFLGHMDEAQMSAVCRMGSVWVFDGHDPAAKGMLVSKHTEEAPLGRAKRDYLRRIGCAA